ncbi:MAG TPA: FKBP-type peptidyl-prolyl cis-trans isomerase [Allosphingosinicella sp.]|nr:FKBP-type peptidyl-prolyl cis-trans isomerase [Allosphingosinicella sp.]
MSVTAVPLRPIKKGSVAKLWAALVVLGLLAAGLAWWTTGHHRFTRTASGLRFQVVKEGEGPTPGPKDFAMVNYVGRLTNGTVFDSNVGQQPAPFPVAEGATVKGFSEALRMMRKGGIYRLRIPPELGYGSRDMGQIPPNSTLEFDVAVRAVMSEAEIRQMMQQQMMMQQLQGRGGAGAGAGGPGGPAGGAPAGGDAGPDAAGAAGGQAPPPQGQ